MTYDPTRLTLGTLLSSDDTTIKRNAMSILKVIQKCDHANDSRGQCVYCFRQNYHPDLCQCCGWTSDGNGKCGNDQCETNTLT